MFFREAESLSNYDAVCEAGDTVRGASLFTYETRVNDSFRMGISWISLVIQNAENIGPHWRSSRKPDTAAQDIFTASGRAA